MRVLAILVCLLAVAVTASAQADSEKTSVSSKEPSQASLQGSVVKDPGGEPIKKAIVELIAENQEEASNYTATSDREGHFKIEGIAPGRYRIFVERTGFLQVDAKKKRSQGSSLSLSPGQGLKDLVLQMQPAAVITGRVLDEDGDPMPNAQVSASRRHYSSGQVRLDSVAGAQTNDLGEYRVGGLLAGKYYVSVSPAVNFQSLVVEQKKTAEGSRAGEMSYVSTYYPGTTDRSQASTVELHPGDETPVNFSLLRIRAAHVRGSVAGLPAGSKAFLLLRSSDSNAMFSSGEVDKDGRFDIPHVAPGRYTVLVTTVIADSPQSARSSLEVGNSDVEGLHLAFAAGALIRGRLRSEPKADLKSMMLYVTLNRIDSDDDFFEGVTFNDSSGWPSPAKVKADGSFESKEVPPGTYEVELSVPWKEGGDYFVESAMVGTKETSETGLHVNGGTIPLDVTLSAGAGVAEGAVVTEKKDPVVNAVVVAVPDAKYRKRASHYYQGSTDQNGRFTIRGIRPGNYTLYAWESLEGDDYLDPEFLKRCEGQGTPIKVEKASRQSAVLKVVTDAPEQP
jgi:protocatechuate 3,4-dioxygenase beta subunit